MTEKETAMLVSLLVAWWPDFKYADHTIKAWKLLCDENSVTLDEAKAALSCLVKNGEAYAPNAPKFVAAVGAVRNAAQGKRQPTAAERWEKLCECAKRGLSAEVMKQKCTGRTWSAVNQAGGWDRIRYANVETELPFVRQAFLKAFEESSAADMVHETATLALEHQANRSRTTGKLEAVKAIAPKLVSGGAA